MVHIHWIWLACWLQCSCWVAIHLAAFGFYLALRAPEEAVSPTKPCLVPSHHKVQVSSAVSRSLTFTPNMKWMAHLFRGTQDSLQITCKAYWKHACTMSLRCFHQTARRTEEEKKVIRPNRTSYFPYMFTNQLHTKPSIKIICFALQATDESLFWLHIGNYPQTNHKVCQWLTHCAMDTWFLSLFCENKHRNV